MDIFPYLTEEQIREADEAFERRIPYYREMYKQGEENFFASVRARAAAREEEEATQRASQRNGRANAR